MATERMTCCGALTRTYANAGARLHFDGCAHATPTTVIRAVYEQKGCCGVIVTPRDSLKDNVHYEGCPHAPEDGARWTQRIRKVMACCGAPQFVNAQTGRHAHYEDCTFVQSGDALIVAPDPEEWATPTDPAETRMMTVSVETLFARGLWMEYCNETGMNEWARNEGQVSDGEQLPLSEAQAVRIGLFPKGG